MKSTPFHFSPFFRKAFALSQQGAGHVEPNPLVGALVIDRAKISGKGFHPFYGGSHAEVLAIRDAAGRGDTLITTLEPCCTRGKTPPCTEEILRSSIQRVIVGAVDPNPLHRGKGLEALRSTGIEVVQVDFQKEWEKLNAPFLKAISLKRPWVIAKWAMTLDGKIATASGDSKWVSGEKSREEVWSLRGRCEAVATGIGTVLADDPWLSPRDRAVLTPLPLRVVFDSSLKTPPTAGVFKQGGGKTVFVTASKAAKAKEKKIQEAGGEILVVPEKGKRPSIPDALEALYGRGVRRLLLEAGPMLTGAFLDANCVDQVVIYISPKLAGGEKSFTPIGGKGIEKMKDAIALSRWIRTETDSDLKFVGFVGS